MKRWRQRALSGASASLLAMAMAWQWEAVSHRAYWDVHGKVWTICAGHTRGVKAGDTATDAQCEAYMQQDMADADAVVRRCITAPLTAPQRAAFMDATFNLGPSIVCGSTLQQLANSGDVIGACLQLTDALDRSGNAKGWTYAGGHELAGLRNRRTDERNLCLGYYR